MALVLLEAFSTYFGYTWSACSESLSSFEAYGDLKKQIEPLFVMHTALAGANACALFSTSFYWQGLACILMANGIGIGFATCVVIFLLTQWHQ